MYIAEWQHKSPIATQGRTIKTTLSTGDLRFVFVTLTGHAMLTSILVYAHHSVSVSLSFRMKSFHSSTSFWQQLKTQPWNKPKFSKAQLATMVSFDFFSTGQGQDRTDGSFLTRILTRNFAGAPDGFVRDKKNRDSESSLVLTSSCPPSRPGTVLTRSFCHSWILGPHSGFYQLMWQTGHHYCLSLDTSALSPDPLNPIPPSHLPLSSSQGRR